MARPVTLKQALLRFALWMVFAMCFFQSVTTTVAWRQEPGRMQDWLDWFWVGSLPALLLIYLRYFSRLGCGAGCCSSTEEHSGDKRATRRGACKDTPG